MHFSSIDSLFVENRQIAKKMEKNEYAFIMYINAAMRAESKSNDDVDNITSVHIRFVKMQCSGSSSHCSKIDYLCRYRKSTCDPKS